MRIELSDRVLPSIQETVALIPATVRERERGEAGERGRDRDV